MVRRQSEQIGISDLPRAMDSRVVEERLVEDRDFAIPVLVAVC